MTLEIYNASQRNEWNELVKASLNGTIFHDLDFLSYHKEKFSRNEHHLIWRKKGKGIVVLPLGIFEEGGRKVARSPYGASYGGFVYSKALGVETAIEVLDSFIGHMKELGVQEVHITPSSLPYCKEATFSMEFAMLNRGFTCTVRDVTHVVKLEGRVPDGDAWRIIEDPKCRNKIRIGQSKFDIVKKGRMDEFYPILIEDKKRLNASITHSMEELIWLNEKFPEAIYCDIATHRENGGKSGICYFRPNEQTLMTFYMAQMDITKGDNGVNALVFEGIKTGLEDGVKYFDFGTSSINGAINNIGVSNFKESFSAGIMLREKYVIKL